MGEAVVEIDDGLVRGSPSLVLAMHLNTQPRSRIPVGGRGLMTRGRVVDQGALPQLAPYLARHTSLKIMPGAGAKHRRAPTCSRNQASDRVIRIGGLRNHAP